MSSFRVKERVILVLEEMFKIKVHYCYLLKVFF